MRPQRGLIRDTVGFRALCRTRARAHPSTPRVSPLSSPNRKDRLYEGERTPLSPGVTRDPDDVCVYDRVAAIVYPAPSARSADRDEVAGRRPRLRFNLVDDKEK